MSLQGRVAIVTGGGSGIGRASCLRLVKDGAAIVVVDRDGEGAAQTVAQLKAMGGTAISLIGDVGEPDFAEQVVSQAEKVLGGVDILVTAAGFSVGGTVLTTKPEDWDAVFRTNVGGTWLFARAAIPAMKRRGRGAIVTFSSQLALAGGGGNTAYIAAKGAVLSLTRTMALDFAPDHIRVNAVAPGAIDTPMLRRSFARRVDPEAARALSVGRHAMKRLGQASEIAEAVFYLASDASSFVTGTTLPVDGGWLVA